MVTSCSKSCLIQLVVVHGDTLSAGEPKDIVSRPVD